MLIFRVFCWSILFVLRPDAEETFNNGVYGLEETGEDLGEDLD